MSSTTFIDGQTTIYASWLNDVNTAVYTGVFPNGSLLLTNLSVSGTVSGAGYTTLVNNILVAPGSIGNGTPNTGAFTTLSATSLTTSALTTGTLNSTGITSLGGSAYSVRQINFSNNEIAWIPNSGTNAFLNVSDSSGNNGGNYNLNIRGLISGGGGGTPLLTFGVSAVNSNFTGIVNASTFKGTGAASAWVYFGGGAGTTAGQILGSYNVSSVSVVSAGNYTINFSNALANNNYVVVGSNDGLGGSSNYTTSFGANFAGGQYSTTACSGAVVDKNGNGTSTNTVRAVFFD